MLHEVDSMIFAMYKETIQMNYISGCDRNQMQFLTLEDMIEPESWARIIDIFVDTLPLKDLGFRQRESLSNLVKPRIIQVFAQTPGGLRYYWRNRDP